VIAAIDWVVQHRTDDGMNIRVLNLSFGTDGTQSYLLDPLAYAAEVAWRKGLVVVVAAGNSGFGSTKLNDPAYDPYLIAVGADDTKGTEDYTDDVIPDFSSRGDAQRHPDFVAPGKSIVSLRAPGSRIDLDNPGAREGYTRFFRGSGTSQAAAFVSGAAALLLQQRPGLTPDQVKSLLIGTAHPLPNTDAIAQGAGLIDLKGAKGALTPQVTQSWPTATGTGTLEGARGTYHVDDAGVQLSGEQDIFGHAWDGRSWSQASFEGRSWSGGAWNGYYWTGDAWYDGLLGRSWSGRSWSGQSWSGRSWSGRSWSGRSWSGQSWSGDDWGLLGGVTGTLSGRSWSSSLWND
jgi:serine protease AprX